MAKSSAIPENRKSGLGISALQLSQDPLPVGRHRRRLAYLNDTIVFSTKKSNRQFDNRRYF
jgi:hypothetical protein